MQRILNSYIAITKKGRPRCNIIEEIRIELATLAGAPDLKAAFDRYGLGYMGERSRSYYLEIVQDFNASYVVLVDLLTPTEGRAKDQPQ